MKIFTIVKLFYSFGPSSSSSSVIGGGGDRPPDDPEFVSLILS